MLVYDYNNIIPEQFKKVAFGTNSGTVYQVLDDYYINICNLANLESPRDIECYLHLCKTTIDSSILPDLENVISNSALYSYNYAKDILKKRFVLGEKAISTHAYCSYYYARNVIDKYHNDMDGNTVDNTHIPEIRKSAEQLQEQMVLDITCKFNKRDTL